MKLSLFWPALPILFAVIACSPGAADAPPAIQPHDLVKRAVDNEIKSNNQTARFMFRQRKETPAGTQTKLMVETRDAMVGIAIAYDDRP